MDALTALANLEATHGRAADAIARVQKSLTKDPRNAPALGLLGELYLGTKDYTAATNALTQAIQLAPTWGYIYRDLAAARIGAGDPKGAVAAYETGVKAAPADAQLVSELAAFYEKQGRVDDAIGLYDALNRRDPHLQMAANNLALLLVTYRSDQKSLDRARDLTASFANSDNGALLDTSGWVHYKRGEVQEALPLLERAVTHDPDSRVLKYHLGMAELRAGQRAQARTNLQTALSGPGSFAGADEARTALASLKTG
jgi:tetratricopeptide (TPR) repeat protein